MPDLEATQYGFLWGPAEVTRLASDPKYGVVVEVMGAKERCEVRVTPAGRIRLRLVKMAAPKEAL